MIRHHGYTDVLLDRMADTGGVVRHLTRCCGANLLAVGIEQALYPRLGYTERPESDADEGFGFVVATTDERLSHLLHRSVVGAVQHAARGQITSERSESPQPQQMHEGLRKLPELDLWPQVGPWSLLGEIFAHDLSKLARLADPFLILRIVDCLARSGGDRG